VIAYGVRRGQGEGHVRVKSFFALVGVIAIPVTIILVSGRNPLPWAFDQLKGSRSLADPATAWRVDVGNTPDWAYAPDTSVLAVGGDNLVTVLDQNGGDKRWQQVTDWASVAGSATGGGAVVVLGGVIPDHGDRIPLQVRDADTGAVLWPNKGDTDEKALAAWTWTDMVVTLTCPKSKDCTLVGHKPHDVHGELWKLQLPSSARTLHGANPGLAGLRTQLHGGRPAAPKVLGFPVDDKVYLVDTARGRLLGTESTSPQSRVVAAGTGMLRIDADYVNSGCRITLRWNDLLGSAKGWQHDQYQPVSSDGSACESRGQPAGDGGLLYVTGADRTESLLDVRTGEKVFSTAADEHVITVAGGSDRASVVLVRSAQRDAVIARPLSGGGPLWQQTINEHTQVGSDGDVVTFVSPDTGELTARAAAGGETRIHATSLANLLGYTPGGLVLNETLSVGLLRYGSVATGQAVHP
jgi:outer membrane protein assembly factor BamB